VEELPPEPTYSWENIVAARLGQVIKQDRLYEMDLPGRGLIPGLINSGPDGLLPDSEITKILRGPEKLWVYGFVRYRDFLEKHHERLRCVAESRARAT
jgi:hypothetical protein